MSKKLVVLVLLLTLVAGAVVPLGCSQQWRVAELTAEEAYSMIENNRDDPSLVILDVRTPEEYEEGHLEGAVNINIYDESFRADISALDRDGAYLVYCRTGSRSQQAVDLMVELEFISIYHMTGGIFEWTQEGLPLVK